jgi:hypothetical protein
MSASIARRLRIAMRGTCCHSSHGKCSNSQHDVERPSPGRDWRTPADVGEEKRDGGGTYGTLRTLKKGTVCARALLISRIRRRALGDFSLVRAQSWQLLALLSARLHCPRSCRMRHPFMLQPPRVHGHRTGTMLRAQAGRLRSPLNPGHWRGHGMAPTRMEARAIIYITHHQRHGPLWVRAISMHRPGVAACTPSISPLVRRCGM